MAQVEITQEEEGTGWWSFTVRVDGEGRGPARTLKLAWADYNLWSEDGADPPHAVARAVVEFLLRRHALDELPLRIDAAVARRRFPEADREIPGLIRK